MTVTWVIYIKGAGMFQATFNQWPPDTNSRGKVIDIRRKLIQQILDR